MKPRLVIEWPLEPMRGRSVIFCEPGDNLADRVMAASPDRWHASVIEIYRGAMTEGAQVALDDAPAVTMAPGEIFIVSVLPAGPVVGIVAGLAAIGGGFAVGIGTTLGTSLLLAGISLVGQSLIGLLFKPESVPTSPTDTPTALNALTPGRNLVRAGSRVPDIFGSIKTWPDIVFPPIETWRILENEGAQGRSQQSLSQVYCLGRGTIEADGFKIDETPLAAFGSSASVTIYPPGSILPASVKVAVRNEAAADLELVPPDQGGTFTLWFRIPSGEVSEIWADLAYPRGFILYDEEGKQRSDRSRVTFEYRRLDAAGAVVEGPYAYTVQYNGVTANPLRATFRITGLAPGIWEVRAREIYDRPLGDNTSRPTQTILKSISGMITLTEAERTVGDWTLARLAITNEREAGNGRIERFNCMAHRILVSRTGPGGAAGIGRTRRWADALGFTLTDPNGGGFDPRQVDWYAIETVQATLDQIDGGAAGQFDAVIDRQISADEQLQLIASAARCVVYFQHALVTVARDERRPGPAALFNRRNRLYDPDATGRRLQMRLPSDPDGVEISWLDRDENFARRVYGWPEGRTFTTPLRIEAVGNTSWSAVYRRARYEWAKLVFRRRAAPVKVTEEGRLLSIFDRVAVVDSWVEGVRGGEILAWDLGTLEARLDQTVTITADSRIRLRAPDGRSTVLMTVEQITGDTIRLPAAPAFEVLAPADDRQIGTLWTLSDSEATDAATVWLVTAIVSDAHSTTFSLIDDRDEVYQESDDVLVPPRPFIFAGAPSDETPLPGGPGTPGGGTANPGSEWLSYSGTWRLRNLQSDPERPAVYIETFDPSRMNSIPLAGASIVGQKTWGFRLEGSIRASLISRVVTSKWGTLTAAAMVVSQVDGWTRFRWTVPDTIAPALGTITVSIYTK